MQRRGPRLRGLVFSARARALSMGAVALLIALAATLYFYFANGASETPAPPVAVVDVPTTRERPRDLDNYCVGLTQGTNPYVGNRQRVQLLRLMEDPNFQSHSLSVNIRIQVARDYLRFGEVEAAARLLTEALETETQDDPDRIHEVELIDELATIYLKMGELDNCLTPSGALICSLPLDKTTTQQKTRGSENAIKYLLRLLDLEPDNTRAAWLLNVAHMNLGTYPEDVPEAHLIPVGRSESGQQIGKFENIAAAVGLYQLNLAGGSIVEDFDNDGLLDIVTSTWNPCGPIAYFHNDGNGIFSDYTVRAGLDGQVGGLNIGQTDYDNDGWMDVLVMRGGWMLNDGQMRVSLLRNNGDGTFADVTKEAGLAHPSYPSQSASWADFDNDGDLDLFSCNESMPWDLEGSGMKFASQLFRNEGDGTFIDVAREAGVRNMRYCKGSTWGDYDGDGDPDLYLSNFSGENRLYRNDGGGSFTDVAPDLGIVEPLNSFATWFWDYNNDGLLDLFVAGYDTDIADMAADYLGLPNDGARMRLYRNDGAGGLIDVTREVGLYNVHLTMGANFGDLDNDGFLDFYLGTGAPGYDTLGPNVAYRNDAGERFVDVTFSGGFGHQQKGHGVAFGDLDRDGDQDIFVQIGGFFPGDGFSNALYENPGHGNRWISVRLVGRESNRAAIGARIKALVVGEQGPREIYAHVNSGGSFGASSLEQEIGLGQALRIESLEIYWPTSDTLQAFDDVPLDSHLLVHEGDDRFEVLDPPKIRFRR